LQAIESEDAIKVSLPSGMDLQVDGASGEVKATPR